MDFRIIKGDPTDEEVAALAIALDQIENAERMDQRIGPRKHRWGVPTLRRPIHHGSNGWRRSSR
jgi:hypothetical protein